MVYAIQWKSGNLIYNRLQVAHHVSIYRMTTAVMFYKSDTLSHICISKPNVRVFRRASGAIRRARKERPSDDQPNESAVNSMGDLDGDVNISCASRTIEVAAGDVSSRVKSNGGC